MLTACEIASRQGYAASAAGLLRYSATLLILFIASNFYEYRTAKISEMAKADLNLSGSGWVVERTYGPSDTIVELKRPRLHLP
jgi:hypothetical protein